MRSRLPAGAAGLLILCLGAWPRPAAAGYCVADPQGNGMTVSWGATLQYQVNTQSMTNVAGGADAARAAVVAAFAAWTAAPCAALAATDGGDSTSTVYVTNMPFVLVFMANDDQTWMQQGPSTSPIAATFYEYNPQNHQILAAAIMLNGAHYTYSATATPASNALDLQSVLMLEIGRALGIAPNPTNMNSVMYPRVGFGDASKRTLAQDDQDAIAFLYPQQNPQGMCANIPPPLPPAECSGGTGDGGMGTGGAGGTPDGGTGASGGDSGCGCAVGRAAPTGERGIVTMLFVAATLGLWRRRRARR